MMPSRHAAISLGLGLLLWWRTASFLSLVLTMVAGFLIDVDHLVEYFRYRITGKRDKLYVLLHSLELLVPLWALALAFRRQTQALVITLGFFAHLASDGFAYGNNPWIYFFIYRARKGFNFDVLSPPKRPMKELDWVQWSPLSWWNKSGKEKP